MEGLGGIPARALAVLGSLSAAARAHWRIILASALAAGAVATAIEISDDQGRLDLSYGYAVRMTCEPDPESHLWSGECDRLQADFARTDKPSFLELYQSFVTAHHRQIPSPALQRRMARDPCEDGFDLNSVLKGTRYAPEMVRLHFKGVCTQVHAQVLMHEIDTRDRALLTIEREGLSHAALFAGALANLTEPLVIFAAVTVGAALWLL